MKINEWVVEQQMDDGDAHTPKKFPIEKSSQTVSSSFNYEDSLRNIDRKCDLIQEQIIVLRHELFHTRKELRALSPNPIPVTPNNLPERRSQLPHLAADAANTNQSNTNDREDIQNTFGSRCDVTASSHTPQQEPGETSLPNKVNEHSEQKRTRKSIETHEQGSIESLSDFTSIDDSEFPGDARMDGIFRFGKQKADRQAKREELLAGYPCNSKYHAEFSDPFLHASSKCNFCAKCHVYEKLFNQNSTKCQWRAHELTQSRIKRFLAKKPELLQVALKRYEDLSAGLVHEKASFGGI